MMGLRNSGLFTLIFSSIVVVALSACGGGGSGPGFVGGGIDDPDGGGGGPGQTLSLNLDLTDDTGTAVDRISSVSPGVLTVTVTTSGGSRVAGEEVSVSTQLATLSPSSGSRLSDDNGEAVFQLLPGGNSGVDTATVTVSTPAGTTTATVSYEVDALLALNLTDTAGNPITNISEDVPGVVTVTSSDSLGNPIEGDVVVISSTVGNVAPASRLTNQDGEAIFSLTALGSFGAGTVTAASGNRVAATNFEIISVSGETNRIEVTLTDTAGNPVTNITSISPGVLTAVATDEAGRPLANQIVSAVATLGVLAPDSGTALTDLNGVASFTLSSDGGLGAGTATVSLGAASDSVNFQIGEANLRIGRFDGSSFIEGEIQAGTTSLPAAGSTPLTVAVVDGNGDLVTSAVEVLFGSGCANLDPPLAGISREVNTVNGFATSTYTANGCTGTDNITAAIGQGNSPAASVSLTVASANVNSIAFVSAIPQSIALKGTGGQGREESSRVAFQVIDNTGAPASGVDVGFELSTTIGGLSLTNGTATTNEDGIAEAIVLAGNVSTAVRVKATIEVDGAQLSTVSDQLVVSTGLPDQDSISLSAVTLNPGGGNIDGITTEVTVRMADKFNNPVPDGTVAFFTAEFGSIDDSCELIGGVCTVTWSSQEPRLPLIYNSIEDSLPDLAFVSTIANRVCPDTGLTGLPCVSSLGPIFGRRSTISVFAVGEESFIDVNGNGVYDVGEPFDDRPEAWLDKNENGEFDNTPPLCTIDSTTPVGRECAEGQEEIFFDFDEDGVYGEANGLYNGSLCPQALADAGDCSRELVHVRDDLVIVMSGQQGLTVLDNATNTPISGGITLTSGGPSLSLRAVAADFYNNLPSAGATLTITADGCEILGEGGTVPNSNGRGAYFVDFTVVNIPDNTNPISGSLTITLDGSVGSNAPQVLITCVDEAF